jgi:nucleoside-diphosphate-sugar epimerase
MPTAPALSGNEFIEVAASVYGVKPKYSRITKLLLFLAGLFNKNIMGTVEMYYQYDHDYVFDSSKFEKAFNFKPTSYRDGIEHMSETLYKD